LPNTGFLLWKEGNSNLGFGLFMLQDTDRLGL
jgi:hypothetical protein